jgi:hypothetical protein
MPMAIYDRFSLGKYMTVKFDRLFGKAHS